MSAKSSVPMWLARMGGERRSSPKRQGEAEYLISSDGEGSGSVRVARGEAREALQGDSPHGDPYGGR